MNKKDKDLNIFFDMDNTLVNFSKENEGPINLNTFLNSSSSKETYVVDDNLDEKIDIEL